MIKLTDKQRQALEKVVGRASNPAGVVRRGRVVLLSADGERGSAVAKRLDLSVEAVSRIRRRFLDGGVEGLADRPKTGRKDHAVPAKTVERIIDLAMSPPPPGRSRWTTRLLAKQVSLTSGCISDVLRSNGLKPHLVRTYKVSRDPEFVAKVKDVVGLYLKYPFGEQRRRGGTGLAGRAWARERRRADRRAGSVSYATARWASRRVTPRKMLAPSFS